jgi:hypothetical protein
MTPLFIDNVYIRGKNSLLQNLPLPLVEVIDNHAYVSLRDIVAHVLSFSTKYNCMSTNTTTGGDVDTIYKSNRMALICKQACELHGGDNVVVLCCTEWFDDFDPLISTKSNCQSCWIKTVTLINVMQCRRQ